MISLLEYRIVSVGSGIQSLPILYKKGDNDSVIEKTLNPFKAFHKYDVPYIASICFNEDEHVLTIITSNYDRQWSKADDINKILKDQLPLYERSKLKRKIVALDLRSELLCEEFVDIINESKKFIKNYNPNGIKEEDNDS